MAINLLKKPKGLSGQLNKFQTFLNTVDHYFCLSFPPKYININNKVKKNKPITKGIKISLIRLKELNFKFRTSKCNQDILVYKRNKTLYKKVKRSAKKHYAAELDNCTNPKQVWNLLNSLTAKVNKKGTNLKLVIVKQEISDKKEMNEEFIIFFKNVIKTKKEIAVTKSIKMKHNGETITNNHQKLYNGNTFFVPPITSADILIATHK